MTSHRILIVDDDAHVLQAVALMLEKAGHEVHATAEIFSLPQLVSKFQPDIVLLDFDMPALTGDKLAASLSKLRATQHAVFIFHSAEDEDKLIHAVEQCGAAGYIPKGLSKLEFLTRLQSIMVQHPVVSREKTKHA